MKCEFSLFVPVRADRQLTVKFFDNFNLFSAVTPCSHFNQLWTSMSAIPVERYLTKLIDDNHHAQFGKFIGKLLD